MPAAEDKIDNLVDNLLDGAVVNQIANALSNYNKAFTYPNNSATDYVDPALHENIVGRFEDITAEILFPGMALENPGGALRAVSKFNATLYMLDFAVNNVRASRRAYNNVPLITTNMVKHNFSFTAIESMTPLTLTTNSPHGIYSGQRFLFQDVTSNNSGLQTNLNNQNFYVKKIDDNTVELYNDAALTSPVDANSWLSLPPGVMTKHYTGLSVALVAATAALNTDGTHTPSFRINTNVAHGVVNGALMAASGFTYYTFLNGNNYYVKTYDGYPNLLKLYLDADLTIPLDVTNYAPEYDLAGISGGGSFTAAISVADISETAPQADSTSRQVRITTDTPHNLIAGVHDVVPAMPLVFTSSNYINFGATTYFVKVVDNNTLDLFLDDALTQPARLADITFNKSGTVASVDTVSITWNGVLASSPLTLQSAADVTPYSNRSIIFGPNGVGLSTTTPYYIKAIDTHIAEVYTDAALTIPFSIANVGADTYGATTLSLGNTDTSEYITLTTAEKVYRGQSLVPTPYKSLFNIQDADHTYRISAAPYSNSTDRPDVDAYNSIADKLADGQRVMLVDSDSINGLPTVYCWTKTEYLGYYTEPFALNLDGTVRSYVYMHCYITRFYSNRSCTVPLVVPASAWDNTLGGRKLYTYNRYFITTYSDLYGVKFTVTGKSAETAAGPFTGTATSGAAKLWPMRSNVTPNYVRIFNSTAHAELNYNNQTNPSSYYIKPTFVSNILTESSSAYTYTVELFADGAFQVPTIINAIPASISSQTGTLTSTISNLAHRTLRYVPILDPYSVVKSKQRYTFSGAYTGAINGTYYVKLIRTFAYPDQPRVSVVELYTDVNLTTLVNTSVTETAVSTPTFYFPFNSKVYSNLYYPKVTDNSNFPFRDGLKLSFAGSHIPYINGNSYYVKNRVEEVSNDDVDIGRHRLDFYTDEAMTSIVDLKALAFAGTIPKLDFVSQAFDGGHKILSFNSATPCVVKTNSTWVYPTGAQVYMAGDLCRNFKDTQLYVKFLSTDASGSYYELYTDEALTVGATYDPTAFTFTLAGSTTPSANEPYPYKIGSLNKYLQGTRWYRRYNKALNGGTGGYEFAPKVVGVTSENTVGTLPVLSYTAEITDPITYSIGTITLDNSQPGKFKTSQEAALLFAPQASNGAPAGSVVDIENGLFNTHDSWTTPSYVPGTAEDPFGGKFWPTHVLPNSATIRTEQPTRVTTSQNQQRYTRTNGSIRYNIELTYPPMKKAEFNAFRAAIEGMQGQWNVCELPIAIITADEEQQNSWCNLFNDVDPGETTGLLPAGSTILAFEGLIANQERAIIAGQFIKILSTVGFPNGGLAVALHDSPSNSWGESKVRITHPSCKAIWAYAGANMRPDTIAVSLNTDTTEYSISTAGYYSLKVSFICTGWA